MGHETTKSNIQRRIYNKKFHEKYFVGNGLDIGCGNDPLRNDIFLKIKNIDLFDKSNGDAGDLNLLKKYNFIYSSNCLEHLVDPINAFTKWFYHLEIGGFIIITVPDEDLYEQRNFPSKYNRDHKWTFTIYKNKSWCNKSINILHLLSNLSNDSFRIHDITLCDTNYNYLINNKDQTRGCAEAFIELIVERIK
jgi:predicted SAM-dependent methyltransferase